MAHLMKARLPARGNQLERPTRALGVALLVVAVLLLVGLLWQQGAERRALLNLAPTERQQVFVREWSNFRTLCAGQEGGPLTDRCRDKAEFVAQFPECRDDCQGAVRSYLSHPAK